MILLQPPHGSCLMCAHSSSDSSEIHAIRNGIWLAQRIGCNRLIIESDSLTAIEAVNQQEAFGPDVAVITECNHMRLEFASMSCDHCFRESNEVADALAKHSFSSRCSEVWEESIPDFISPFIVKDLSII